MRRLDDMMAIFSALALFAVGAAVIGGWIANIVKLFGIASDPLTGMFILRCVGVFFAPVGAVLGYV